MGYKLRRIKPIGIRKRVKVYPKEEKKEWDFSKADPNCKIKGCYGRGYTGVINREIKGVEVTEKVPCKCVVKWHRENDKKEKKCIK